MKILLIHNRYNIAGGEDSVLSAEMALLIKHDQKVKSYFVGNDGINNIFNKILAAFGVIFSVKHYFRVKNLLRAYKPDVVHVHNYFPLLSPSIFFACKHTNTPVVHTLHNYRAVCPTALLMNEGEITEESINKSAWWTVTRKVYRNSFLGTFVLALMVEVHKKYGTWTRNVDRFIILTEFAKTKYVAAGWPLAKLIIKPNFIADPSFTSKRIKVAGQGKYCLFIGRLSPEKGILVLLDAWEHVHFPLKVIGEGDLVPAANNNLQMLGRRPHDDVLVAEFGASFIIVPSICYEGFPMAIVEAFACGTPVLCSRLGSMEEIVEDGVTGLHFEAGNAQDLAEKAQWLIDNPERTREMGQNARNEYLAKYTPEKNYEMLMDIYQQAIEEAKKR